MFKRKLVILVLVSFLLIPSSVSAHNEDYVEWTWADPANLSVQTYTSADMYKEQISNHVFAWDYIKPSNVYIKTHHYRYDDVDLGKYIRFHGEQLTGTTLGTTGIYTIFLGIWILRNFWTYTGTVDRAKIILDTRPSGGLPDRSTAQQNKTIIHELGHALALDHPDCGTTAIMQQGYTPPAALNIQPHDESNLRAKW